MIHRMLILLFKQPLQRILYLLPRLSNLFLGRLVGLLLLQQFLSWTSLKSRVMRKWFEGSPVLIVDNGRILYDNLRRTHFNLDDLRQELHKQGLDFSNLKDIKVARLESSGDFSVIKHQDVEPLTRRDWSEFIQSLSDNPLGPAGGVAAKFDRMAADIALVADYIRQQQAADSHSQEVSPESSPSLH